MRRARTSGFTLIEVMVTVAVLGILASATLSLGQAMAKRNREIELRRSLRIVRTGIDRFRAEYEKARIGARDMRPIFKAKVTADRTGYPLTLDELVETRVIRRVPRDPMNPDGAWLTLSYSDLPGSSLGDGRDVWDVRSASRGRALDGTTYDTW